MALAHRVRAHYEPVTLFASGLLSAVPDRLACLEMTLHYEPFTNGGPKLEPASLHEGGARNPMPVVGRDQRIEAKMRSASARLLRSPMSYQMPGTRHV